MAEPGIFEILYSTRAMRRLKPDPIPDATLKQIIDAGIRAPSGGNVQEWAFLLVRDPAMKKFIREQYWNTSHSTGFCGWKSQVLENQQILRPATKFLETKSPMFSTLALRQPQNPVASGTPGKKLVLRRPLP